MINRDKVCIVGGAGHVGLPLGLAFSSKNFNVVLIDKDKNNTKKINEGKMPFIEKGCANLLKKMLSKKIIFATNQLKEVKDSKFIIVCIGTPVNNKLNLSLYQIRLQIKNYFN